MARRLVMTYKAIEERAVNSPKKAKITEVNAALSELALFDGSAQMQGNRKLSPFGHNATAGNGDIDFALTSGARTLDEVIDKVHRYCKTRKAEYSKDRSALAKRVIEHLRFLAGVSNGKNQLYERIMRFKGPDSMQESIEFANNVHRIMKPIHARMNKAYLSRYK